MERQTGQQDSDPYTPVTVEHILDTVNSQRALVLYFSMAAGYLYSWLLAPGAGSVNPEMLSISVMTEFVCAIFTETFKNLPNTFIIINSF